MTFHHVEDYEPDPTHARAWLTTSNFLEHRKYAPDDKPLFSSDEVMAAYLAGKRDGFDAGVTQGRADQLADDSYRWTCRHTLSGLPCTNSQPHKGNGLGCTHTGSSAPDRHDLTEGTQE